MRNQNKILSAFIIFLLTVGMVGLWQIKPVHAFGSSIVATMGSPSGIRWQQKTFYASGRYWLFYVNGTFGGISNSWFTSSVDAVTWAAPTLLRVSGEQTGENLEAILGSDSRINVFVRGVVLAYRKGTPNSDGSITWLSDWQTAWNPGGSNADFYATLDSNGFPWVSWCIGALPCAVYVSRSDSNTGTWHTASGYPIKIASGYNNNWIEALSNGEIYVLYFNAGSGAIHGSLWNGASWSVNETVSSSSVIVQYSYASESWSRSTVVDANGNVALVFLSTTHNLVCIRRTASDWGSEVTLASNLPIYASPSLDYYPSANSIGCYYVNDAHSIYSLQMNTVTGVWDASPTLLITSSKGIPTFYDSGAGYDGRINGFSQALNNLVGIVWVQNGNVAGTFDIMFTLLSPPPPESQTPFSMSNADYAYVGMGVVVVLFLVFGRDKKKKGKS